ncbi:xylogalacturonan beta-1,3-xylosyltransferase-like [Rhodamnia argentea]|uniref:Xylogalacturonan beta-1,3-xylosyltransferase-like n=1 Tax=Rhodamnia argentea TaxID=178133 RepID=A0A8B8P522_9MYRT|nr:xylogalacturonan beta-1,3-xylosyltransferase-like [Rhodamnia argentea]
MGLFVKFQMLFLNKNRRWLFLVALVAATHLMFQSLLLPYGNALQSLLLDRKILTGDNGTFLNTHSFAKSAMVRNPLTVNISESAEALMFVGVFNSNKNFNGGEDIGHYDGQNRVDRREVESNGPEGSIDHVIEMGAAKSEEGGLSSDKIMQMSRSLVMQGREFENHTFVPVMASDNHGVSLEQTVESNNRTSSDAIQSETLSLPREMLKDLETEFHSTALTSPATPARSLPSDANNMKNLTWNASNSFHFAGTQNIRTYSQNQSSSTINPGKKKMRCDMPPKSVTTKEEMNHIYLRNRVSSRSMRPRWSSIRDQEILAAKVQIENARVAVNNQELYSPLFRNVSMFIRSYQLMEHILKVYVYKEGGRPVFHQPILKGLYASEGWFMKLMEGNKQFVVKDPRKAHLFYMPFSSRMLEYAVYVRNSHNRTNLRQYLKQYTDKISARYPFFNRTGGADHFLVACHDWAPYETRHHMERCIKALCNADVTAGFKIGRDVSLPETYVRSARNPLRDLGGKPLSQRRILAFYADLRSDASWGCKQDELHPPHEE